ncbi:hypothetical protein chiPu_0028836, partial [Chiloscyllium punctatum]|nr:hypothetical protein [Chiloscyllium punctatum]
MYFTLPKSPDPLKQTVIEILTAAAFEIRNPSFWLFPFSSSEVTATPKETTGTTVIAATTPTEKLTTTVKTTPTGSTTSFKP